MTRRRLVASGKKKLIEEEAGAFSSVAPTACGCEKPPRTRELVWIRDVANHQLLCAPPPIWAPCNLPRLLDIHVCCLSLLKLGKEDEMGGSLHRGFSALFVGGSLG